MEFLQAGGKPRQSSLRRLLALQRTSDSSHSLSLFLTVLQCAEYCCQTQRTSTEECSSCARY